MALKSSKSFAFRTVSRRNVSSATLSLAAVGLGGVLLLGAGAGRAGAQAAPPEAPPTGLPTPAVPAVPPTPVAPPATPDTTPPLPTNTTVVPAPYTLSGTGNSKDKNAPKSDKIKRDGKKDGTETGDIRPKGTAEKLLGPLFRDITITGGTSLSLRRDGVTGGNIATQTYSEQNVNTLDQRSLGPFRNNMDMTITGRVFNAFNINARLSNSRYGNQFNQVFGVNYKDKGTTLDLGNVNAALPGNNLVTFSRSLEGIVASREFGKIGGQTVSTTGIASLTRAVTRKGSFQGNGTTGPFYMNASSLREGSEIVRLNGQDLQRDKDYRIDYLLGQITFLGGRIINTGDTVEFSYEAQNYNTSPGLLTGTRINIGGPGGVGYGLTYLQQKTYQNKVSGNGTVSEYYPVVADLNQHYQLTSLIDASIPVRVYYRDRTLTEGIDYVINRDLRYVLLKTAFTPDTSQNIGTLTSLRIEYKPIRQSSANGDRAIVGFDTVQRISQNGTVNMQFGQSQSETAAQKGQAMTLSTTWHSPEKQKGNKWTATAGLKNVGLGFSPIESVASAYLQAEKGGDLGFTFAPNQFFDLQTNVRQSKVANVYQTTAATTSTASAPVWVTNQSLSSSLNFRPKGDLPIMSLTHAQTGQNSGQTTGTRSSYSSDAFNASWSKGILGLTGALTRTATQGRSIFSSAYNNAVSSTTNGGGLLGAVNDGTFSQAVNNSNSTASRLQASVNPTLGRGMTLGMTGEIGFSNTRNGAASNGTQTSGTIARARNTGFGLNFAPLQTLNLTTTWNESTNGQSTAGYYNSSASSTTSGVLASQITNTLTGQKTRGTTYAVQYAPSSRLSFGYNGSRSLSLVPGYDNSENVASNWNLAGTPLAKLQLSLNLTDQKVSYVGGQGNSANKSTTVTGVVGPFGKVSLTGQLARTNYNSATYNSFGGNTIGGTGSGTIAGIGDNLGTGGTGASVRSVGITRADSTSLLSTNSTNGYTTGYLQNGTNTSWSVQSDYSIGGNKSLFARWRSVDQGTPTSTAIGGGTIGDGLGTTYHSATNYQQGVGTVGLEFRLTDVVGFALEMNVLHQHDRDDSRYSYRARTFNVDLTARF